MRDDEEKEYPDDLPAMKLLDKRSVELYFLERAFPSVPLFEGPVIEWPDWYFTDRRVIARVEAALQQEKEWERKAQASAERQRKEMMT